MVSTTGSTSTKWSISQSRCGDHAQVAEAPVVMQWEAPMNQRVQKTSLISAGAVTDKVVECPRRVAENSSLIQAVPKSVKITVCLAHFPDFSVCAGVTPQSECEHQGSRGFLFPLGSSALSQMTLAHCGRPDSCRPRTEAPARR